jgi:hypothetical protein
LAKEIEEFAVYRSEQATQVPTKDLLINKTLASIQYIFGEFREFRLWPQKELLTAPHIKQFYYWGAAPNYESQYEFRYNY